MPSATTAPRESRLAGVLRQLFIESRFYRYIRYTVFCILHFLASIHEKLKRAIRTNAPFSKESLLYSCYEENNLLSDIWRSSDDSNIIFLALDLRVSDTDPQNIAQIGLASWCLDGTSAIDSSCWYINYPGHSIISSYTDSGRYTALNSAHEFLQASDISHYLSSTFHLQSLSHVTRLRLPSLARPYNKNSVLYAPRY
ncbi:hypothetical protein F4777DRAFT_566644 [Nemania sp. FL0916]|nr:hypothetical protein F4777DRAFT_566644 [Nemania sp. FL0916]